MNDQTDEIMAALVVGIQALREAERQSYPLPIPRPVLRLVPNCGTRVDAPAEDAGDKVRTEGSALHAWQLCMLAGVERRAAVDTFPPEAHASATPEDD